VQFLDNYILLSNNITQKIGGFLPFHSLTNSVAYFFLIYNIKSIKLVDTFSLKSVKILAYSFQFVFHSENAFQSIGTLQYSCQGKNTMQYLLTSTNIL